MSVDQITCSHSFLEKVVVKVPVTKAEAAEHGPQSFLTCDMT